MTSKIRQIGDPILRQTSAPLEPSDILDSNFHFLLGHMQDVLNGIKAISSENGNALSAPQVGHLKRLILLRIDGIFIPMVNPEISSASTDQFEFLEECFSLYDQRAVVSRYHDIEVNYLDEFAQPQSKSFSGEYAALIQHEIDHLNGVLFVDHVDENELQSIDYIFEDDSAGLTRVKAMMAYMISEI